MNAMAAPNTTSLTTPDSSSLDADLEQYITQLDNDSRSLALTLSDALAGHPIDVSYAALMRLLTVATTHPQMTGEAAGEGGKPALLAAVAVAQTGGMQDHQIIDYVTEVLA